jgi:hypothetical protein
MADLSTPHLNEDHLQSRLKEIVDFHNAVCELAELFRELGAECLTMAETLRSQENHYRLQLIKGESLARQKIRICREID